MKKTQLLTVFLIFLLIFHISAIQEPTKAAEELPNDSSINIPVILKSLDVVYWQAIIRGVNEAAEDYGVNVQIQIPQLKYPANFEEQLNLFKNALAKKPTAIVLSALDPKALTPYLEQAKNANIPVIALDTDVDSPIVRTAVSTDNYGAGELAAHKMAELIGQNGKVAVPYFAPPTKSLLFRYEGFVNTLKENYPNIEIIQIPYTPESTSVLSGKIEAIIRETPELKGLFATAENESRDAIDAIKHLGKEGQIKVIAFDSGKKILDAIKDGTVSGAITQDPVNMGYKAVQAAIKASKGEILPTFINTGFTWYDKSNMDTPEIKSLIYE